MLPIDFIINTLFRLVNALEVIGGIAATAAFFFGLAKYIWAAGDEGKAKDGRSIMTWGVLAMFVLVSIGGIIGFLQQSTGTGIYGPAPIPITIPHLVP